MPPTRQSGGSTATQDHARASHRAQSFAAVHYSLQTFVPPLRIRAQHAAFAPPLVSSPFEQSGGIISALTLLSKRLGKSRLTPAMPILVLNIPASFPFSRRRGFTPRLETRRCFAPQKFFKRKSNANAALGQRRPCFCAPASPANPRVRPGLETPAPLCPARADTCRRRHAQRCFAHRLPRFLSAEDRLCDE